MINFFSALAVVWLLLFSANRFGPKVSGIINGIPLIAGVSYILLGLEQGTKYASLAASENALGAVISVLSLCVYLWTRQKKWPLILSLLACGSVFIGVSLLMAQATLAPTLNHLLGFSGLIVFHFLLKDLPVTEVKKGTSSQQQILFRAILGALLIWFIAFLGNHLPEVISGKMVALPISALAVLVAIENDSGIFGVNAFLKATPVAFLLNVFYTFMIWLLYPAAGVLWGTLLSYLAIIPVIWFSLRKN